MRDSELEAKLEQAPVGYAVFEGPDMVFKSANERYLAMVSRTREQAIGHRWADVYPELVGTPTHDAVLAANTGTIIEVKDFAVPLVGKDGTLHEGFYSFSLHPTRGHDGEVTGFMVIAVEVTELVVRRREAEELARRLHESEERYRTVFAAITDAFCVIEVLFDDAGQGRDYRFLEVNAAFVAHTGLREPLGKTATELVPDLDGQWARTYGRVALTGESVRFEDHAPAMARWFDVFAVRVGEPARRQVALIFKDVTLRKEMEKERERVLVVEKAARRDAEEANRLKDEFLATVSHELRTPLNAMLGWISLLRAGHVSADQTAKALATIERNARSQAQLVEDLLDVSRILEGKLRIDVQHVELAVVVQAALDTVRPAAEAKGVRLQPTLASGASVMGDAHRLQQIIWNLLSNAVKFTPRGGRVQVLVTLHESSVEISVTDTGVGMTEEFLPYAFERFRQADGGSTRTHGGLGLGLSIAKNLTELHGGTLSAASAGPGKGSSFTVRLPLALMRASEPSERRELDASLSARGLACPPEVEGLDVLTVDDEEDSRAMLRQLLEACGATVRTAASVAEARRLFEERRPNVVVSDIGMPDEDGYAFIAWLRARPVEQGGDVPTVALTAYARTADRTRCLLAGFSTHVPKPVEPMELLAVVASLSGRTPATRRGG